MNVNATIQAVKRINRGQWFKMVYISDVPLCAQAKREGRVVYKKTTCTVRWGLNYSNIGTVKERFQDKVDKGETVTHELPWGKWSDKAPKLMMIEHKEKMYLRVYTSPNKFDSVYYVDGVPITKEGLATLGIVQPSYFKKSDTKPEALTIKVENIESIG